MTRFYRSVAFAAFLFAGIVSYAGVSSPAHIARMNQYDVTFYWLDLEIQKAHNNIGGNALTRAKCIVNQMDTFALELASTHTVDSVMVAIDNGDFITTSFTHASGELNVLLSTAVLQNQLVDVRVFYHGAPVLSNLANNSGFFTGNLGKFSASPPYNSNTWWPCKQSLTDLADSSWFYVTTAAADRGIGNGVLTNVVDLGENKRWEWKSKYPINFYLIAFVVTSFEEVTEYWHPIGRTDSLRLDYYGYVPEHAMDILQVFSDKFGLYPFYDEKLAFAKVNLAGGIENQTIIASNGDVDAHEIAHQWFGNYVGCASWKDVMLSEGLSTWAESVYAEFTAPDAESANAARMSFFSDNLTVNPVYGAALDTANLLSVFGNPGLYYRKAAMVINTLRYHVNDDELFFDGIRNYLNEYGGRSAYGSDFKAVMESTTGLDLEDFFNQWYYKGGAPTFNITWNSNGTYLALQIQQTTNNPENPLYKTPVDINVQREEGDLLVRLFIDANETEHLVWCPGTITGFQVDPHKWITNGIGTATHNPDMVVGVDNVTPVRYTVAPNPAKDRILITTGTEEIVTVKIFDMMGGLRYANDSFRLNQYLELPAMAKGSYIVQIADGQSLMVHKLLID